MRSKKEKALFLLVLQEEQALSSKTIPRKNEFPLCRGEWASTARPYDPLYSMSISSPARSSSGWRARLTA